MRHAPAYPRRSRQIAGFHAAYLVGTGLWPLLHRRSFEAVSGRKTDFWLVRTVGGLAVACGAALGLSVVRGRQTPEVRVLAATQALVFLTADLFAAKNQSSVYLGDVAVQAASLPSWFIPWTNDSQARAPHGHFGVGVLYCVRGSFVNCEQGCISLFGFHSDAAMLRGHAGVPVSAKDQEAMKPRMVPRPVVTRPAPARALRSTAPELGLLVLLESSLVINCARGICGGYVGIDPASNSC